MQHRTSPAGATPDDAPEPDRDDAVRALVERLARPHLGGGHVVDRASLLAAGSDFAAAVAYIEARGGVPEHAAAAKGGGLHGARERTGTGAPLRFVLPPGALG